MKDQGVTKRAQIITGNDRENCLRWFPYLKYRLPPISSIVRLYIPFVRFLFFCSIHIREVNESYSIEQQYKFNIPFRIDFILTAFVYAYYRSIFAQMNTLCILNIVSRLKPNDYEINFQWISVYDRFWERKNQYQWGANFMEQNHETSAAKIEIWFTIYDLRFTIYDWF